MLGLRRSSTLIAGGLLIAGPTVVAFFDGGFFNDPRLIAGVIAWLMVALAALTSERPMPLHAPGRIALGGLFLLSAWTALSLTWAPLGDLALADVQRLALYCGFLIAASAWLGRGLGARSVEPGLALGAVVVIGYGMLERFLPSLVELQRSSLAFGRLEQPLTYWNGMGLLAAIGLVLCARLAGSATRPAWMRSAAAGAAPLLGAGLLLTLSRGALAAVFLGMLLLLLLARDQGQPRAVLLVVVAAGLLAVLAAVLPGLDVVGERASSSSGAFLLAATLGVGAAAALVQHRHTAAELQGRPHAGARSRGRRLAPLIAVGLLALGAAVAATLDSGKAGAGEALPGRGAERLKSLESTRYRYWEVAAGAFAARPLRGLGSAGFQVEWAREGGTRSFAREAHSLYVETAAELGLVGLALLVSFLAGLAASARRALARQRAAAVGPAAVLATWAFHAGFDWDWELPAVTLPALTCAGMLIALGDGRPGSSAGASAGAAPESAGVPPPRAEGHASHA